MTAPFARFLLLNIAAAFLLLIAIANGWVQTVIAADQSRLSLVIAGVLVCGLALTAWRFATLRLPEVLFKAERSPWLAERVATIRLLRDWCPMLGFAGTLVGFYLALGSIDIAALGSADAAAGVIGGVLKGTGTAITTTLCGIAGYLWLDACRRVLDSHVAGLE